MKPGRGPKRRIKPRSKSDAGVVVADFLFAECRRAMDIDGQRSDRYLR